MSEDKESDVLGLRFGKLTITADLGFTKDNSGSKRRLVECSCDCTNIVVKKLKYLKSGETKSCGKCKKVLVGNTPKGSDVFKAEPINDELSMVGSKYGRLTVNSVGYKGGNKERYLEVICDCGSKYFINKHCFSTKRSKSCGCYKEDLNGTYTTTHGMSKSSTYGVWLNIIQRCTNPSNRGYADYGNRGIQMCKRWKSFENFLEDMGEKPHGLSIERLDVNRGYCKENCTWADRTTQAVNRRKFKNNTSGKTGVYLSKGSGNWLVNITVKGKTINLGTFSDKELAIFVREEAELKYFGFIKE